MGAVASATMAGGELLLLSNSLVKEYSIAAVQYRSKHRSTYLVDSAQSCHAGGTGDQVAT